MCVPVSARECVCVYVCVCVYILCIMCVPVSARECVCVVCVCESYVYPPQTEDKRER